METDGLNVLELAQRHRVGSALVRAMSHPDELALCDEEGRNALHLKAASNTPVVVVHFMSRIDPETMEKASLARDCRGLTPLLIATSSFAPLHVVEFLAYNERVVRARDKTGSTCLHHVCSQSRRGFSSLRRSLARADLLLEVDPTLAKAENDAGDTPIHVLCQNFEEGLNVYWLSNEPDVQLGMLRFDVDGLWLFLELLLQHAQYARSGNILHQIVSMPSPPLSLVTFTCRRSPELIHERDENGNTPLHVAIQRQLLDIASHLARKFPECVTALNKDNESALDLAARSCGSFHECIFWLIAACPRQSETVVSDDRLYAHLFKHFVRSATISGYTAVFDMLQRRPDLACGIQRG